ncbi:MAG: ParB N-terminal domain-containing protein [Rhodospirillales bacterium]
MKYVETIEIPVDQIDDTGRLRQIDPDWARALAESIGKIGQKEPIEVVIQKRKGKPPYRLIAGGHRLEGCRQAGMDTIRAEVKKPETDNPDLEMRLHEIDENLIRNELNALDRAVFLGERQKVWLEMYPETAHGKTPGNQFSGQKREVDIVSFSQATAEKIDLAERTIRRATLIYQKIPADIRARLHGSSLARNQGELIKLTRYSEAQQARIVDACLRTDSPAPSVSVAAQELDGRTATENSPEDAYLASLQTKFNGASKVNKEAFLTWLHDLGIIDTFDREQLA